MHVVVAAEDVVYEVVAEPQEPLEQAQQEERREARPKAQFTTVPSSTPKASSGACSIILNYDSLYICLFITYALSFRNYLEP